jgi:hypothetical protein
MWKLEMLRCLKEVCVMDKESIKAGNFFTGFVTLSFSRRIQPHGFSYIYLKTLIK